jgi:hypothetical protein
MARHFSAILVGTSMGGIAPNGRHRHPAGLGRQQRGGGIPGY